MTFQNFYSVSGRRALKFVDTNGSSSTVQIRYAQNENIDKPKTGTSSPFKFQSECLYDNLAHVGIDSKGTNGASKK